jgi:hypothetical protein
MRVVLDRTAVIRSLVGDPKLILQTRDIGHLSPCSSTRLPSESKYTAEFPRRLSLTLSEVQQTADLVDRLAQVDLPRCPCAWRPLEMQSSRCWYRLVAHTRGS